MREIKTEKIYFCDINFHLKCEPELSKMLVILFNIQGGPQKCPFFSLAITFIKIRKFSRFFLHRYWKFVEFF